MEMSNQRMEHVIGIPVISGALLLTDFDSSTQCGARSDDQLHSSGRVSVLRRMNKLGKKADLFVNGFREHVRLSPKIMETVKGKLSLGARVLQMGGMEKVFKALFNVCEKVRLLKASQCYLSTTSGPIAGVLFISTRNIAVFSERSLKMSCPNGETFRVHYKILIPLSKIKMANQSDNVESPWQKHIQIITVDNFDFWFMGFLNYQKAWKYLQQAILFKQGLGMQLLCFGRIFFFLFSFPSTMQYVDTL